MAGFGGDPNADYAKMKPGQQALGPVKPPQPQQAAKAVPVQATRPSAPPQQRQAPIQMPVAPPPTNTGPMTNTSTPNPTITKINQAQMGRFEGDMGAGRASQVAAGQIRDSAEGELKAMRGGAARRGVSGGGLEANLEGDIRGQTVRNIAGSSTAISQDAELRRDALGGQIAGQAAMDENLQNQQRNTAIRQMEAQSQTRLAEERGQRDAMRDRMAMFQDLADLQDDSMAAMPIGGGSSPGGMFSGSGGW